MSISQIKINDTTTHDIIACGLTSTSTEKIKLNATNIAYGTCTTAGDNAAKVVTISGNDNWTLTTGSMITVKFSNSNSVASPTLNVNNTGAYPIYYNTTEYTSDSTYGGYANRHITYQFNGTHWVFISWSYDANSDTKVTQSAAITTAGEYPVILGYNTKTTSVTNTLNKTSTLKYNPSTKVLTAPTFKGNLTGTATDATDAVNATNDANGNNIVNTYLAKTDAENIYLTQTNASSTYETANHAEQTYETKDNANHARGEILGQAKKYTDDGITALIGGAPEALKTLEALGDALDDDENFAATVATNIGKKQDQIPESAPATTLLGNALTKNVVLVSDSNGKVGTSGISTTKLGYLTDVTSNIQAQINTKSDSGHTHLYAGSSTAGGIATNAARLSNTTAIGGTKQPVYFDANGVPKAISYSINKSVPSDAKFTDTTYSLATTSANGLMASTDKIAINTFQTAITNHQLDGTIKIGSALLSYSNDALKVTFIEE